MNEPRIYAEDADKRQAAGADGSALVVTSSEFRDFKDSLLETPNSKLETAFANKLMINSTRVRVLLVGAVALASIVLVAAAVWVLQKRSGYYETIETDSRSGTTPELGASPLLSTAPVPSPPSSTETNSTANSSSPSGETGALLLDPSFVGKLNLIIPVVGVRAEQLLDTFKDARSEGRVHDAIDIPAPAGTPVVAAAEGEIVRLFQSDRGGVTIYQLSPDKKLVFYYAHLQRYADGLSVGKFVRQGELIGYVGDSGNAGAGNFHLHFSIAVVADPKRHWDGTNINPYPLLRK